MGARRGRPLRYRTQKGKTHERVREPDSAMLSLWEKGMKGFFCGPPPPRGTGQAGALASVQFGSQLESLSLVALRLSGALAMWGQQTPLCPSLAMASVQAQEAALWWPLFQGACPSPWGSTGQATGSLGEHWASHQVPGVSRDPGPLSWPQCVVCLPRGQ